MFYPNTHGKTFWRLHKNYLQNRHGLDELTSGKIAHVVWTQLESRDIRDVLAIAKLTEGSEDVEFVAMTLRKYKRNNDEE